MFVVSAHQLEVIWRVGDLRSGVALRAPPPQRPPLAQPNPL